MRRVLTGLCCWALLAGLAVQVLALDSESLRRDERSAAGAIFIGPDESRGNELSVWFTESDEGDRFWIGLLKDLPPAQQSFFRDAAAVGHEVYIEATFEWRGEGNVIRDMTGYGMQ